MANTKVKICGLQSVEVLKSMLNFPPDYAGFVFAPSKRRVEPEQAAAIIAEFPETVGAVGVFVNPTVEELKHVLAVVPLRVVQLHGQETPDFCSEIKQRFNVEVWKALAVKGEPDAEIHLSPYVGLVDAFLIDTYDPHAAGGTGVPFPWDRIPAYQRFCERHNLPLFVAGGLNGDNIADLLREYRPYGVDVSSGVETNGVKDPLKIEQFIERVKRDGHRTR